MNVTTEVTIPNLPIWMRQARRGVDWGVIIVIGLSLITSWSFIVYPTLPHTNASENYVYRAADYAQSIREGRFYPRWSPNALGGYGSPIPNFYAPGAPYIAALLDVLLTDDTVLAVRLVYIISLCVAGAVVYVFVTRRENAAYGILAGTLYVFSPYVGLVAPHVLGNLPDVVSLALIPSLFWAVDRLLLVNRPPDLLLIALITAALFLTSVPSALVGISLSLCLLLWNHYIENRSSPILQCLTAFLLGIGIAGFFWIPALLEQNTVNWQIKSPTVEPLTLTLSALFSPLNPLDTSELHNTPQLTLGLIIVIFTIVSALSFFRHLAQRSFQAFFLLAGLVILILGLMLLPAEIWLVGVATLCFSIAGSAVLSFRDRLKPRTLRRLFLPSCIVLIWISSNPLWLNPQTEEHFGTVTPETQIEYEQQGYGIAVLPQGFLVPSTLPFDLPSNRALLDSYHTQNINKMAPGQISASFQASPLVHFTHSDHFQVRRVVASGPIDILTAYFPGWYATLGNQTLPLARTPDTGLIRLDVPTIATGNSELVLTLGPTDVRTGSWLIAGFCLMIISVMTVGRVRRQVSVIYEDMTLLSRSEARLLAITLGCLFVAAFIFSNPAVPFSLRARPGYLLDGSIVINTRTDAGLSVYSFRLDTNQHRLNDSLNLTMYWQAQRSLPENYLTRLFLVNNRDGNVYAETDLRPPGYFPTRRWKTHQYVTDRYTIPLKSPIPAGNYQIHIELYSCNPDCASANHLNFFSSNGELIGTSLVLPTLIVIEP